MENGILLIGAIALLYFLFRHEDRHKVNMQEVTGHYYLSSAVSPFALGLVFLGIGLSAKAVPVIILSFTYFIWSGIQVYRSIKNNNV